MKIHRLIGASRDHAVGGLGPELLGPESPADANNNTPLYGINPSRFIITVVEGTWYLYGVDDHNYRLHHKINAGGI